ncbi:hypothetical protein BGX34_004583 [Mortierella sp. NVP85]|nr:hypothetical protein BGX34_004583 [Mortierella sp. NVP85]
MDSAIDTLTKDLKNGGYFRRVSPKDYDAKDFFARFDDKRRARAIWTKRVLPRLLYSKHPTLQRAGAALLKKWNSRAYRRRLNQVESQEEIILNSVRKHQKKILDHSYEDLCRVLKRREASLKGSKGSMGVRNTIKSGHIATGGLGSFSSTAGEQASGDPSSRDLMGVTGRDSTVENVDGDEDDLRLDLYTMAFSVFNFYAALEHFWQSQVWGVLDTLFFDVSNTLMIGGEGAGLDSTEHRNQQQHGEVGRELPGSKSNGYLRMFGTSKSDWISEDEGG